MKRGFFNFLQDSLYYVNMKTSRIWNALYCANLNWSLFPFQRINWAHKRVWIIIRRATLVTVHCHRSVSLVVSDFGSKTEERTLKVCPSEIKDREFLIIGHSGGDSHQACENTIAATKSALKRSILLMNGLRLQNQCNLSR